MKIDVKEYLKEKYFISVKYILYIFINYKTLLIVLDKFIQICIYLLINNNYI